MVKILLDSGANCHGNNEGSHGSPLNAAAFRGSVAIVEQLCQKGVDVNDEFIIMLMHLKVRLKMAMQTSLDFFSPRELKSMPLMAASEQPSKRLQFLAISKSLLFFSKTGRIRT